jgi:hypothetical protein
MKTRVVVVSCLLAVCMNAAQAGPCTTEIDNLAKAMASKDAGQGPTPGAGAATSTSTPAGQHPPGAVMGKQSEGKATSSRDVSLQNTGQPPAGEKGTKETAPAAATNATDASAALARARQADAQGKEADCMSAVAEAKRLHAPR